MQQATDSSGFGFPGYDAWKANPSDQEAESGGAPGEEQEPYDDEEGFFAVETRRAEAVGDLQRAARLRAAGARRG